MKPDLSIIIPYANEWPQIAFTIQATACSIGSRLNFEIIVVDNWCQEIAEQVTRESINRLPDRAHDHVVDGKLHESHVACQARHLPWLRYMKYEERLSHWQCKRVACAAAKADTFLFIDAHVVPGFDAIVRQFEMYQSLRSVGTLHLPLTYHVLESHKLIYALVDARAVGNVGYTFVGYRDEPQPYEVPCMSTCGMMMSREVYSRLGGWPEALGIYGGGEHFCNFTMAVLGLKKFIATGTVLHHHGEKRNYSWNWSDYQRNRGIANYIFGGEEYLRRHLDNKYGTKEIAKQLVFENVVASCATHRAHVEASQVETIDAWLDKWSIRS